MMSRPMVLVFLFLILIITSQFEWKQQFMDDLDSSPSTSEKQQHTANKVEVVKEKVILLQEKNIQRLNELVQSLQQQLLQCQGISNTANTSSDSLITNVNKIEGHHTLED